jgi:hypothetical protein
MHVREKGIVMTNTPKGCLLLSLNLLRQINALHDWRQMNVHTYVREKGSK